MVYLSGKANGSGDGIVKYGYGTGVYGIFSRSIRVIRAYLVSLALYFLSIFISCNEVIVDYWIFDCSFEGIKKVFESYKWLIIGEIDFLVFMISFKKLLKRLS